MISGILAGIATGSTVPDLGNATFNFIAGLPRLILVAGAGLFSTFGS